ncbi:MAG: hypothetical protein LBQ40_01055 [Clostridiales bacterium]|jgi:hypothetical protein|nr:hypothetical protein [Clostridiales bacterium]
MNKTRRVAETGSNNPIGALFFMGLIFSVAIGSILDIMWLIPVCLVVFALFAMRPLGAIMSANNAANRGNLTNGVVTGTETLPTSQLSSKKIKIRFEYEVGGVMRTGETKFFSFNGDAYNYLLKYYNIGAPIKVAYDDSAAVIVKEIYEGTVMIFSQKTNVSGGVKESNQYAAGIVGLSQETRAAAAKKNDKTGADGSPDWDYRPVVDDLNVGHAAHRYTKNQESGAEQAAAALSIGDAYESLQSDQIKSYDSLQSAQAAAYKNSTESATASYAYAPPPAAESVAAEGGAALSIGDAYESLQSEQIKSYQSLQSAQAAVYQSATAGMTASYAYAPSAAAGKSAENTPPTTPTLTLTQIGDKYATVELLSGCLGLSKYDVRAKIESSAAPCFAVLGDADISDIRAKLEALGTKTL